MSDKVYLRDLVDVDFTKDEFISYYNRCMFLGLPVCEDASFKIGKYKNISCGIFNVQDEDVVIPGFVDEIYNNEPYLSNVKLRSLDLNNVKTLCRGALNNYYHLEIVKADNVKTLGAYSFYGCSRLEEISLPKLKYLGSFSFSGCRSLSKFSSLSLKEITKHGLSGCGLEEIYTPNVSLIKDFGLLRYDMCGFDYKPNVKIECSDTLEIYTPFDVRIEGNYEIEKIKEIDIKEKYLFRNYFSRQYIIKLKKSDKLSIFNFRDYDFSLRCKYDTK